MEFTLNLLSAILLGIWSIGSIAMVICLIQNIINDHKQEKREVERVLRDKEYHEKRMSTLR